MLGHNFFLIFFSSSDGKPSLVCHGYCVMVHIHLVGWSIGSKHGGACLWNDSFRVMYMIFAMALGFVVRLPFSSIR